MGDRWWASTAFAAAALAAVAACSGSGSGSSSSSGASSNPAGTPARAPASNTVKTTKISGVTVLTNAKGFTLYSFALDTATKSMCNGQCAKSWPPLKGPVTVVGMLGAFSAIKRSGGSRQVIYNGHPLYTYAGDTAPGQAKGNGLKLSGGVWKEIVVSRSA
jgi:predicted lipoprotein with Yx(FWY)xxD motif